jgi:hypothetical protein
MRTLRKEIARIWIGKTRDLSLGILLVLALAARGQQTAKALVQVDTQLIELNQYGFIPKQVTRGKAQYYIFVRNVTGLRNLTVKLVDRSGTTTTQQNLTATSPHWRELLQLSPGKYTLSEASHPSWTC